YGWQANNHARAAVGSIFGNDRPTVRFDNRSKNGQAPPHSFLFSGKEVIEDFIRLILWQSRSKITHAYFSDIAPIRASANNDAAFARRQSFHGVESINNQVKQNLLDLNQGGADLRKLRIQLGGDDAFATQHVRADQPHGLCNNGIEVQQSLHARLLAHQTSNSADHFTGALTVGHHVL